MGTSIDPQNRTYPREPRCMVATDALTISRCYWLIVVYTIGKYKFLLNGVSMFSFSFVNVSGKSGCVL